MPDGPTTYALDALRRWNPEALLAAADGVSARGSRADDANRVLECGASALDKGWDGRAADAVVEAVENDKRHVATLAMDLEDLEDALQRAGSALRGALATLQDRLADAEAVGLRLVGDTLVAPEGRDDVDQSTVDLHAEAIRGAIETVRSFDVHYAKQIDEVASALHSAIPAAVDRSPIPGPDDPWPARGVDAMTGAMTYGLPKLAEELDPETRGRHLENPAPDHFGRPAATGLRLLGKVAGPLGTAVTVHDGVSGSARGETTAGEAVAETTGALLGGAGGGAAAGAAAGSFLGPFGAIAGAGIGAAVGAYLGQKVADKGYEVVMGDG